MRLNCSDFETFRTLEAAIWREVAVRVVFQESGNLPLHDSLRPMPKRDFVLPGIMLGRMTIGGFIKILTTKTCARADVRPSRFDNIDITVVGKTGLIPAKQTYVKNISFAYGD